MTGPDDGQAGTRPISVAELLAKNGTIGAPPVGGRRRRRRGNNDSVTVAELTGEIPIVRARDVPVADEDGEDLQDLKEQRPVEREPERPAPVAPPAVNGNSRPAPAPVAPRKFDVPRSRPELAPEPLPRRETTPQRSNYPRPVRKGDDGGPPPKDRTRPARAGSVAGAELMSPDPIDDVDETSDAGLDTGAAVLDDDVQPDELGIGDPSYLQSYLRATSGALFGGQTVTDDLARRGPAQNSLLVDDDIEVAEALEDEDPDEHQDHDANVHEFDVYDEGEEAPSRGQLVLRGGWIALQSILAAGFGAGLFIAFDQLWKWNNIVALVLAVLVILGLVVGVRVVRKTEDIASTLIAVAVGALVTLGPLALLQSN